MSRPPAAELELIRRLELHAVEAWPPTVCEHTDGGWVLRATPGLDRGRSNTALTPCRELTEQELAPALAHVYEFAALHGIRPGLQVSPAGLHERLESELRQLGWRSAREVVVMSADAARTAAAGVQLALELDDHASSPWLRAWTRCDPRGDVEAHSSTVFARLRGRARFAWHAETAIGIAVASSGLIGLFSLAVAPDARRRGVGSALVRALLAGCEPGAVAYLQVEDDNAAAIAMYERLGFEQTYRYRHWLAPAG